MAPRPTPIRGVLRQQIRERGIIRQIQCWNSGHEPGEIAKGGQFVLLCGLDQDVDHRWW